MSSLGDLLRGEGLTAPISADTLPSNDLSSALRGASEGASSINWTQRSPVEKDDEFDRIYNLPRRQPNYEVASAFSHLWRPEGCGDPKCPFNGGLREIQKRALHELKEAGGLLAPIGVGGGKALITLLAPSVMEARNSVLLVPPQLVEQTVQVHQHMTLHWRCRISLRVRCSGRTLQGRCTLSPTPSSAAPGTLTCWTACSPS